MKSLLSAALFAATLSAQVPVNLDEHPMPAGMSAVTEHIKMGMSRAALAPASSGIKSVETRSNGDLRYGVYQDSRLTPEVVRGGLKKLASIPLPGDARGMEAQPLFAAGVLIKGKPTDLVLAATMGNYVYAFDAHSYRQVWKFYAGTPIVGTKEIDGHLINDKWGIISTPVINGNMLYCVAWVSPDGTWRNGAHWLFEVDLTTGKSPRKIQLTKAAPIQRKQRAALTFVAVAGSGHVLVPWGTVQETATGAHGFITAVNIGSWSIADEWASTAADSKGSGLWWAGGGLVTRVLSYQGKEQALLSFITGNGDFDPSHGNYGESFVNLWFDGEKFRVASWWTPFTDAARIAGLANTQGFQDMDLGSGQALVFPEYDLFCGAGKDSIMYCTRLSNPGNTLPADLLHPAANYAKLAFPALFLGFDGHTLNAQPDDVQYLNQVWFGKTRHQHGAPLFWQSKLYNWSENGHLRAWQLSATGLKYLGRGDEAASPYAPNYPGGMPGAMMAIAENSPTSAVLFACVPDGDANAVVTTGRVFAYDISKFTGKWEDGDARIERIWMSDDPPAGHYTYGKFAVPVVNDGRLWVVSYAATLDVYGVK